MIHDDGRSNFSGNRPFQDVLKGRISRRNMLKQTMFLSAAGFIGAIAGENVLHPTPATVNAAATKQAAKGKSTLIGFDAVPLSAAMVPYPAFPPTMNTKY
jgi:hypothetical protein